jgi:tRNA pseudouridine13 synthase
LRARRLFAGEPIHDRLQRGFALSAARAAIFNAVLAHRVAAQSWNVLQAGEVANLDGSNSIFSVDVVDEVLADRCQRQDIHPSGPLWGAGELQSRAAIAALEQQIAEQWTPFGEGLAQAGLLQERRSLRLRVAELRSTLTDGQLRLSFRLPRGAFATSVLHELIADVFVQAHESEEE